MKGSNTCQQLVKNDNELFNAKPPLRLHKLHKQVIVVKYLNLKLNVINTSLHDAFDCLPTASCLQKLTEETFILQYNMHFVCAGFGLNLARC